MTQSKLLKSVSDDKSNVGSEILGAKIDSHWTHILRPNTTKVTVFFLKFDFVTFLNILFIILYVIFPNVNPILSEKLEKVKKQLDALKLNNGTPKVPDSNQIKEILAQHYDPSCDFCAENLPPSLEQIQAHYNQQHSMNGYLRCCNNVKLKTIEQIIEHAIFHLHPEYYK